MILTIVKGSPELRICEDPRKPIKIHEKSSNNEVFAKSDINATDESLPAYARRCQQVVSIQSVLCQRPATASQVGSDK